MLSDLSGRSNGARAILILTFERINTGFPLRPDLIRYDAFFIDTNGTFYGSFHRTFTNN